MLLCHGFPELWYSWRHQLGPLADAGFHVVAVDLPGYGRSDKPDVSYDIEWVNACLAGVVTGLGHERAVLAGHDWGGLLVWPFARRYPELTAGVIGVNTPDLPRTPIPMVELLRQHLPDDPPYIVQFQDPGVAEWVFSWGRGAVDFLELMFRSAGTVNQDAFPDEVIAVYAEALAPRGALTPPIDYYRNLDRSWHLTADLADVTHRRAVPDDQCRSRPGAHTGDDVRDGGAGAEPREGRDRPSAVTGPSRSARPRPTPRCSATCAASTPGPERPHGLGLSVQPGWS